MSQRSYPQLYPFCFTIVFCYISFLYLDVHGFFAQSTPIKYTAIFLCLGLSLTNLRPRQGWLTALALACSLLADTFLLLLQSHYSVGISLFCVVQCLLWLRIRHHSRWTWCRSVAVRLGLAILGLWALHQANLFSFLWALSLVYFLLLLCNLWESLTLISIGAPHCFFPLGFALLLCCDLCVGLHNIPQLNTPYAHLLMWVFYLPAQVLLTLLGFFFREVSS